MTQTYMTQATSYKKAAINNKSQRLAPGNSRDVHNSVPTKAKQCQVLHMSPPAPAGAHRGLSGVDKRNPTPDISSDLMRDSFTSACSPFHYTVLVHQLSADCNAHAVNTSTRPHIEKRCHAAPGSLSIASAPQGEQAASQLGRRGRQLARPEDRRGAGDGQRAALHHARLEYDRGRRLQPHLGAQRLAREHVRGEAALPRAARCRGGRAGPWRAGTASQVQRSTVFGGHARQSGKGVCSIGGGSACWPALVRVAGLQPPESMALVNAGTRLRVLTCCLQLLKAVQRKP